MLPQDRFLLQHDACSAAAAAACADVCSVILRGRRSELFARVAPGNSYLTVVIETCSAVAVNQVAEAAAGGSFTDT